MRALILSDIHSNLEALEAVLEDAEKRDGFEAVWVLGDTVGYGPDPVACLALLRGYNLLAVAGNHDHGATGKIGMGDFNGAAYTAAVWTGRQLSAEDAEFLNQLPEVATAEPFTLVHGSLRAPLLEYLISQEAALATFELLPTRFCLVGHSHYPFICLENQGNPSFVEFSEGQEFRLGEDRWIINPGSVGQPRDRDPRPSFAVYDDQEGVLWHYRVPYDIKRTQDKMRRAGLPQVLISRLDQGV
ncbi:MAG: metallophosphoesterase family protein [Dehalococcoidia bacterium]